jgi:hypothetical protein
MTETPINSSRKEQKPVATAAKEAARLSPLV